MPKSPILRIKERENAGAIAANRFSYQVNWGVCMLMKLHTKGNPYVLIMEKHDDAIICDDIIDPKFIDFYQIKSKKGKNWNITKLTASYKSKKSIIAKMYSSKDKFGELSRLLSFRTDAMFSIEDSKKKGKANIVDRFRISDLSNRESTRIKDSIEKEFEIKEGVVLEELFEFESEPIKWDNHIETTKGLMASFFDEYLDRPFRAFAYTFIAGEVHKRNNVEKRILSDSELRNLKCIEQEDFEKWIQYCINNIRVKDETIIELENELKESGIRFKRKKRFMRLVEAYLVKQKGSSPLITKLQKVIQKHIEENEKTDDLDENIVECARRIYLIILDEITFVDHLEKDFLLAAIMYEIIILL